MKFNAPLKFTSIWATVRLRSFTYRLADPLAVRRGTKLCRIADRCGEVVGLTNERDTGIQSRPPPKFGKVEGPFIRFSAIYLRQGVASVSIIRVPDGKKGWDLRWGSTVYASLTRTLIHAFANLTVEKRQSYLPPPMATSVKCNPIGIFNDVSTVSPQVLLKWSRNYSPNLPLSVVPIPSSVLLSTTITCPASDRSSRFCSCTTTSRVSTAGEDRRL